MPSPRYAFRSLAIVAILALVWPGVESTVVAGSDDEGEKPSLSLKVSPGMATAPVRLRASVVARGGDDDYKDFYCATVEWEWGDGTVSEAAHDCAPYERGSSTVRRRFSATHTYREGGRYTVIFRLKQKDRIVGMTTSNGQVLSGFGTR